MFHRHYLAMAEYLTIYYGPELACPISLIAEDALSL